MQSTHVGQCKHLHIWSWQQYRFLWISGFAEEIFIHTEGYFTKPIFDGLKPISETENWYVFKIFDVSWKSELFSVVNRWSTCRVGWESRSPRWPWWTIPTLPPSWLLYLPTLWPWPATHCWQLRPNSMAWHRLLVCREDSNEICKYHGMEPSFQCDHDIVHISMYLLQRLVHFWSIFRSVLQWDNRSSDLLQHHLRVHRVCRSHWMWYWPSLPQLGLPGKIIELTATVGKQCLF